MPKKVITVDIYLNIWHNYKNFTIIDVELIKTASFSKKIVISLSYISIKMDFTTLMQQAQKLVSETQNNEDLPQVERSMPQILKATNEVLSIVFFVTFLNYHYPCSFTVA